MSLLEDGPIRRMLREGRLLKQVLHALRIKHVEVDSELERMVEAKKSEWRAKGYSEKLINMAVDLANDWAGSMAEAFAPPEFKAVAIKHIYPKALEVADRWITTLGEAAKAQLLKEKRG